MTETNIQKLATTCTGGYNIPALGCMSTMKIVIGGAIGVGLIYLLKKQ